MSSLMAVRADAVREALDNFPVLLLDLDAGRALHILGIGRLQFRRRARLLAEWRGLCMALWRLALQRSFPEQAEAMFRQFRESFGQSHTDKTSALALERAPAYWEVLAERGDADFRPVSRFLAAVFFEDEARAQAMALRLMLHVRQTYQSIFDRLRACLETSAFIVTRRHVDKKRLCAAAKTREDCQTVPQRSDGQRMGACTSSPAPCFWRRSEAQNRPA